jgi:hypothetical protein
MSTKLTSLVTAHYILLARCVVLILGCIAVWWGIVGFSVFWQESSTERIASRIIAGDPFKIEILAQQTPIIDSIERSAYCRPAALRSAAIIQLRMVEAATSANDSEHVDNHLESLGKVIRGSLSCAPADPFLWLVLHWVESTENVSKADYLKYLRMSYLVGPSEGWIALKRNRVAFARFQQLPSDLAEITINEFIALIESRFYEQAADIFIRPAWLERDRLLLRLKNTAERHRKAFYEALRAQGYNIDIPVIKRTDPRPWH